MLQNDPKNKENQDAAIKPDPETLGPEPQKHMDGPISTLVRKVGEKMSENDQDVEPGEETEK